ncbi:MAG: hypothetical protein PVG03_00145 [Desulfarculaceae bacterium]|jgi:hypothetical protein
MALYQTENLEAFLKALAYDEQPLGMFYTDQKPSSGYSPKPKELPTAEQEARDQVDWQAMRKSFSCVLGIIWLARSRKTWGEDS